MSFVFVVAAAVVVVAAAVRFVGCFCFLLSFVVVLWGGVGLLFVSCCVGWVGVFCRLFNYCCCRLLFVWLFLICLIHHFEL